MAAASDAVDKGYLKKIQIANYTVRALYDARKRNSFGWKHFGTLVLHKENKKIIVFEDQVFCNVCLSEAKSENETILFGSTKVKSYNKSVSTGNLIRHLRDDHGLRVEDTSAKKSIRNFFTTMPRQPSTSSWNMTEQKIKVRNFEINYVKVGNGSHYILLMPNTYGSIWCCFEKQIEGFDKSIFTVVAWDPPGYGKSRPPDRDFCVDYLEKDADYAYEFMKVLQISTYSILGWCAGGRSALILAAKHPDVVRRLVVWSTNSYITAKELEAHKQTADTSTWPPDVLKPLSEVYDLDLLREYSIKSLRNMTAILEKRDGNICNEFLKDIRCPTLILYGEKDRIVDRSHVTYLSSQIANSTVYIYPNGKHRVHITHAEDFNRRVQKFLEPDCYA